MPIKKIEGLASIEDIEEEIQKDSLIESPHRKNRLWPIILSLIVVVVVLIGIDWFTSDYGQNSSGYGTINGSVVNLRGTPVIAEIFVLDKDISTTAAFDGTFSLGGVPAGDHRIIVAWQGIGKEIPIKIKAGETIPLGKVVVEETKLPPENMP